VTTTLPSQIHWPSKAPIGRISLAAPKLITPDNPCGWFENPESWPTEQIPRAIAVLKELGAQAVIAWDLDAADRDHYLGCPDLCDKALARGLAEQFIFEGFEFGCTVRCDEWNPVTRKLERSPNPYETLLRKIKWAHRWLGCRIFYLDTPMYDRLTSNELLSPTIYAALHKQLPDCLLIPEHYVRPGGSLDDPREYWNALGTWRVSAPYMQLNLGGVGTPASVLERCPDAFSIVNVTNKDGLIQKHADELRGAFKRGDVAMCDVNDRNICIDPLLEILRN
jgi:hypothetical protein